MKPLWLEAALDDLDAAIRWIADYDPNAALKLDDVEAGRIEILRFLHGARQFPPSFPED